MSVHRESGHVLVIGSANVDVAVMTAALPRPGETIIGHGSLISPGGKGSNQAVAAAACGAATRFVGRTGADAFGDIIRNALVAGGVNIEALLALENAPSGLATISVEDSGRNAIIVVPGANGHLKAQDLDGIAALIATAAVVVLQCEIPLDTVYRAIELAGAAGTPVILNPAPYCELDMPRIAARVTYFVPNETEAARFWGQAVENPQHAADCATWLCAQGILCAIITLGDQGCVVADQGGARLHPAHRVAAVDTTGAGDAFIGCLAASLATGHAREQSIRRALLYSALSVTARGAQISYPRREEFERAWRELEADQSDAARTPS